MPLTPAACKAVTRARLVGERECFDSSCTGQTCQTGNQLDDGVACGLFADKADRDADIGQGAGEFEQPRGDKAGEQDRFDQ